MLHISHNTLKYLIIQLLLVEVVCSVPCRLVLAVTLEVNLHSAVMLIV